MDADRGGDAGDRKKAPWPEVKAPPALGSPPPASGDGAPGAEAPPAETSGTGAEDTEPEAVGLEDTGTEHTGREDAGPKGLGGSAAGSGPSGPGPSGPVPSGPAPSVSAPSAIPGPSASSWPPVPSGRRTEGGLAALSLPYQVVAAMVLTVVGLLACVQLAMVFLHVAPSNTLTKQHGEAVDKWIYPEFEQNWKLFAPNPLQQNIAVHVRAEVVGRDGRTTTGWTNLSGMDGEAIRGNPLPSHVHQNELRRAWDFYTGSHDEENRPNGLRGELSEQYIRRIVMLRLSGLDNGGTVERIQIRSAVSPVGSPSWSDTKVSTEPTYRELPWWTVTAADLPGGRAGDRTASGTEEEK
ncbi:hypothetical protein CP967_17310 [Streptomyces nitrosporeus]|uniref:Collagen-like protein n=1 Tax=Streptomyces nitrosporeus TaxID=28894 RepID=A0A5J6FMT2_9ACTN|nr:DUF5819 family protein [Streptomyces nitrosporeus]QEU76604.1 hypothetical protein CP967_17310 [Streptomyces nitrosporeus]